MIELISVGVGSFLLGILFESVLLSRHVMRLPAQLETKILDTPIHISDNVRSILRESTEKKKNHYRVSLINGPVEDCKYDGYDYDLAVDEWHDLEHGSETGSAIIYKNGKIHSQIDK
jgi:hypothetical protein